MSEQPRERRRWAWSDWRILGGAPVPPVRRTLRAGDGLDEASIGGGPSDPGGGADIARDWGDLGDPFADEARPDADRPAGDRPDARSDATE
jgi:hypothetical protein